MNDSFIEKRNDELIREDERGRVCDRIEAMAKMWETTPNMMPKTPKEFIQSLNVMAKGLRKNKNL